MTNYTNPISKISSGLFNTITSIMTTKEGLTFFFIILTIVLFVLWLNNVIKKIGGVITLVSFMSTLFMCWITWACDC